MKIIFSPIYNSGVLLDRGWDSGSYYVIIEENIYKKVASVPQTWRTLLINKLKADTFEPTVA